MMTKYETRAARAIAALAGLTIVGTTVALSTVVHAEPRPSTPVSEVTDDVRSDADIDDGSVEGIQQNIPVGANPTLTAVLESLQRVYVVNSGDATVSVIDATTNAVTETISVPAPDRGGNKGELIGIAVDEGLNRVYVANNWDVVTAIDAHTNAIIGTPFLWGSFSGIAVDQSTHKIYVLSWSSILIVNPDLTWKELDLPYWNAPLSIAVDSEMRRAYFGVSSEVNGSGVLVLDTVLDEIVTRVSVPVKPERLAVDESVHKVYATGRINDLPSTKISVIDGTLSQASTIEASAPVHGVTVDKNTHNIYALIEGEVSVFDSLTGNCLASYFVNQSSLSDIAFDHKTQTIYVPDHRGSSVTALRVAGGTVIDRVAIGSATNVAVDEASGKAFVIDGDSATVRVIEGDRVREIPSLNGKPISLAINQETRTAYVATEVGWVLAIDADEEKVERVLTVRGSPQSIVVDEANQNAYLSDEKYNVVTVIDCSTNTVRTSLPLGTPGAMVVDETTQKIYVANKKNYALDVIDAATVSVVGQIVIGQWQVPENLAIDEAKQRIYAVTNFGDIVVVDASNGNVVDSTMTAAETPIVVDQATHLIYTVVDNAIQVFDGETYQPVAVVNLFPEFQASSISAVALDQRTGILWVTNNDGSASALKAYR